MAKKIDYKALGFKCGIEIHQQLDTSKLYCNCPSLVRDPNKDVSIVTRRLRPVIGETGVVDSAASYEASKSKLFIYEFRDTSSCLIELDEEPPREMNPESLAVGLQVAKMLNAKVVDEIQVMRKIVVDGSNVSGFQRTALIAIDGYVETSKGRVGVPTICLEEESAQKLETGKEFVRYRLDRLGVPLIEIATDASIQDADHAQETAQKLGMILRSTKKVKRGIGSIRQDVNVSIKGGTRVEVKGFQDLKSIPKVVDYEVERQLKLVRAGKKVAGEVRKAEPDFTTSFLRPMPGAARMYPETDVVPVRVTDGMLSSVQGVELFEDVAKEITSKYKLPSEIALKIVKSERGKFFSACCDSYKNLKPSFIADLLLGAEKSVQKDYGIQVRVSDADFKDLFEALDSGSIAKESVLKILSENKPVKETLSAYALMSDGDVEAVLKEIIKSNKGAPYGALMGKAMGALRGKASGKKIAELLKKLTS